MSPAPYAGPIENIVTVMFEQRSYDEVLGSLYDAANDPPYVDAPPGQRALDAQDVGGLRPAMMPVTAFLANRFMVCDRWFAPAAAQRFTNRLFAHSAAPGGVFVQGRAVTSFTENAEYRPAWGAGVPLEPTIFSQLDAVHPTRTRAGDITLPNWKVYFHDYSIAANLLAYVARWHDDRANVNLANYDECDYPPGAANPLAHPTTTFLQDVAQGTLPPYAFIEPRHGSFPRPSPVLRSDADHVRPNVPDPLDAGRAVGTVFDGEQLLLEVYLALRHSRYWERSLLIVVYDAPGAVRDHVAPPAATPPGALVRPAANGYAFDTFGGRVPAIIVSPYVEPGSTLRAGSPFDHTSLVKTVWHCFGLEAGGRASINDRDAAAPSILDHLTPTIVNRPTAEPAELIAS